MKRAGSELSIVLVTNTRPHHKYWACSLFEKHNVVAILHPSPRSQEGRRQRLSRAIRNNTKYGYVWFLLKASSLLYNRFTGHGIKARQDQCEELFFKSYEEEYDRIPKHIVHHVNSVNDTSAIKLVRDLDTDIICFLGGDVARKDFIDSARIASLNFHSGISPFYNGSGTIHWAVSDYRPNLAGGTLMYITERIDGGPVIAHYLPPIAENDDASSLFMKTIIGSVKLYDLALQLFYEGGHPIGIEQQRSFRYVRGIDWTIAQDLRLAHFDRKGMIKEYVRDEEIITYFGDSGEDRHAFDRTLASVLRKG